MRFETPGEVVGVGPAYRAAYLGDRRARRQQQRCHSLGPMPGEVRGRAVSPLAKGGSDLAQKMSVSEYARTATETTNRLPNTKR